jgi:hypothetical protein
MSAGADVVKQVRLGDKASLARMRQMTEDAIAVAMQIAIEKIRRYALTTSDVPRDTGRLQDTIGFSWTARNIVLIWTATDPKSGFHYADHVDTTHKTKAGFSDKIRAVAKEIFRQEIINALRVMTP